MILVDTGVWITHMRQPIASLAQLLERGEIGIHPFVIGELALGNLRGDALHAYRRLPQGISASHREVMALIMDQLHGTGVGYVDAHLLASTLLTPDAAVWTRDRSLSAVAQRLGVAADFD
jgi:predicted nucleic acid-binding protein